MSTATSTFSVTSFEPTDAASDVDTGLPAYQVDAPAGRP